MDIRIGSVKVRLRSTGGYESLRSDNLKRYVRDVIEGMGPIPIGAAQGDIRIGRIRRDLGKFDTNNALELRDRVARALRTALGQATSAQTGAANNWFTVPALISESAALDLRLTYGVTSPRAARLTPAKLRDLLPLPTSQQSIDQRAECAEVSAETGSRGTPDNSNAPTPDALSRALRTVNGRKRLAAMLNDMAVEAEPGQTAEEIAIEDALNSKPHPLREDGLQRSEEIARSRGGLGLEKAAGSDKHSSNAEAHLRRERDAGDEIPSATSKLPSSLLNGASHQDNLAAVGLSDGKRRVSAKSQAKERGAKFAHGAPKGSNHQPSHRQIEDELKSSPMRAGKRLAKKRTSQNSPMDQATRAASDGTLQGSSIGGKQGDLESLHEAVSASETSAAPNKQRSSNADFLTAKDQTLPQEDQAQGGHLASMQVERLKPNELDLDSATGTASTSRSDGPRVPMDIQTNTSSDTDTSRAMRALAQSIATYAAPSALVPEITPADGGIPLAPKDTPLHTEAAGLILLWPYLKTFLDKRGLLPDGTAETSARAAWAIHHLAGRDEEDDSEPDLLLARLLAGYPLQGALQPDPGFDDDAIEDRTSLLQAVAAAWPGLHGTSPEGLQETFLNRESVLHFDGRRWTMTVPRQRFDVLLSRLPWNISTVRLSWMTHPIFTHWGDE